MDLNDLINGFIKQYKIENFSTDEDRIAFLRIAMEDAYREGKWVGTIGESNASWEGFSVDGDYHTKTL